MSYELVITFFFYCSQVLCPRGVSMSVPVRSSGFINWFQSKAWLNPFLWLCLAGWVDISSLAMWQGGASFWGYCSSPDTEMGLYSPIPLQSESYQEDIYPMTAGVQPALTAQDWLNGTNKGLWYNYLNCQKQNILLIYLSASHYIKGRSTLRLEASKYT